MPNLSQLKEFAKRNNNNDAVTVIQYYEDMASPSGYYFLGEVQMKVANKITNEVIKQIKSDLYYNEGTSFFIQDSSDKLQIILQLIEEKRLQRVRINGLFRVIIFWLSPARKRATEKVFHPTNFKFNVDSDETYLFTT